MIALKRGEHLILKDDNVEIYKQILDKYFGSEEV